MKSEATIFGIRAIIEAIKSESSFNKVYLQKGLKGELFTELEQLLRKHRIATSIVPIEKLHRLSKGGNHQGAVAKISPVSFRDLEEVLNELDPNNTALFLLLDGVSDVRNFGAILRTAEITGVNAVIIPKSGNAPLNSDAIKTSAGAAFKLPICKVDHIKDAIYLLQAHDINIIAATEKTDKSIYDLNLSTPLALIMGSEDKGVNPSVLKIVNEKAKLPIIGETESLNVSVACGAILYEILRQRL